MYQVKNIDRADWKERRFMVIRDCRREQAPNDGYWFWGSYDDLATAHAVANSLGNGVLVETSNVESIPW